MSRHDTRAIARGRVVDVHAIGIHAGNHHQVTLCCGEGGPRQRARGESDACDDRQTAFQNRCCRVEAVETFDRTDQARVGGRSNRQRPYPEKARWFMQTLAHDGANEASMPW